MKKFDFTVFGPTKMHTKHLTDIANEAVNLLENPLSSTEAIKEMIANLESDCERYGGLV